MRIFASPHHLAAVLLLVYPAALIAEAACRAADYGEPFRFGDPSLITLALLYGAASLGLWWARRWAYGFGMALAAFGGGVLVLVGLVLQAEHGIEYLSPFGVRFAATVVAAQVAAVAVLLRRETRALFPRLEPARSQVRLVAATVLVESVLMGVISVIGLRLWQAYWYEHVIATTQIPGTFLLTLTGWCCGYESSLILSDHGSSITWDGMAILLYANVIGLLPFATSVRKIVRKVRVPNKSQAAVVATY